MIMNNFNKATKILMPHSRDRPNSHPDHPSPIVHPDYPTRRIDLHLYVKSTYPRERAAYYGTNQYLA